MGFGDMIVIAVLAVVIFFSIRSLVKQKKNGGCCGDCATCGGCCHSHAESGDGKCSCKK